MPFIFQIRPVTIERGVDLLCEGILNETLHYRRLIEAIIHAAQLGRDLDGEIQIFDPHGQIVEVLPLRPCSVPDDALEDCCA